MPIVSKVRALLPVSLIEAANGLGIGASGRGRDGGAFPIWPASDIGRVSEVPSIKMMAGMAKLRRFSAAKDSFSDSPLSS
jgi:hypothetical protein